MNEKNVRDDDLKEYRMLGLPMLYWLGIIGLAGIVLTALLGWLF